ncbi:GNAT family N-acetyltransferase [Pseudorhodobacter turbinis]|uniref:GNAT family N-acetyltransferase n=1 Tax=Pseudorhodobacter turbinis TaxID=2500533 RepID=A0A4P8EH48_9RHOB|nr:GNAT family N-acetyltransferase [Pseudorhodobacter turbinis]QCO56266.1 GNAT family N-acetyltransferase [Pseudorhodobacter turbinis]
MSVTLCHGLPDHLRDQAAELYWDAFGSKLGRVMGPRHKAIAFLLKSMRADHAICALSQSGALLGLVAFKSHIASFAGGGAAEMRAVYGLFGAFWRMGLMSLLERDVENERFLLDGICVVTAARGQGIGTQLLIAICDKARAQNYPAVRLDVIDRNPRARALYERFGFVAEQTDQLGPLRYIFGFAASTSMIKQV